MRKPICGMYYVHRRDKKPVNLTVKDLILVVKFVFENYNLDDISQDSKNMSNQNLSSDS